MFGLSTDYGNDPKLPVKISAWVTCWLEIKFGWPIIKIVLDSPKTMANVNKIVNTNERIENALVKNRQNGHGIARKKIFHEIYVEMFYSCGMLWRWEPKNIPLTTFERVEKQVIIKHYQYL